MSVSARFAKLLVAVVDPQLYAALRAAAEQRAKTLNDCLMEAAETTIDKTLFRQLKQEAEAREAQALEASKQQACDKSEPPKLEPKPDQSHVQQRLAERYSMEVTDAEIKEIEALIKSSAPSVKLVKREAVITSHYEVQLKGKRVSVVYSPKKSRVVTALPMKNYQKPSGIGKIGKPKDRCEDPRSTYLQEAD